MELNVFNDVHFMKQALNEAHLAFEKGEVPVGAVIVSNKKIIARGHNLTEQLNDVTAHAEMLSITSASNHLGGKYLEKCTLYVTLEPCAMCAGALFWSHIGKIVFAASDDKRGFRTLNSGMPHPKTEVVEGIMAEEAKDLLLQFFKKQRANK